MELTSVTPSLDGLKALTHPTRLRMLGMLRIDGPATASSLAVRLGLNSGATSYHLRQLAQHGFIVEDPERGNARDRWWKAGHQSTVTRSADYRTPEQREHQDAFLQAAVVAYTQQLQAAVEERPMLPQEWREASTFSDWEVRLTPARARALTERLKAVLAEVEEDAADDAEDDVEIFAVQIAGFPFPGRVSPSNDVS